MGTVAKSVKKSVGFGNPHSSKEFSGIIKQENLTFKDQYNLGHSMGSSYLGEVRKCKNITMGITRAVKIVRKERLNDFETQRF